jgi:Uma2 family endonuclease
VVCDLSKLDDRGCLGAPDLVVEILSDSSIRYDMNDKFNLYEAAGVREYWVVFPAEHKIMTFILQADGKYDNGTPYIGGQIPVHIFNGLEIAIDRIFNDI